MDIGIGIPNAIPTATGGGLLDWARRSEEAGFSTLATIGAVSYGNYEELTVLAAAAAVTEEIGLMTNILVAPVRTTAELAKQSATVDELSGGRLTLGLAVGWREIDFEVTGRDFADRGETFDRQLRELHEAWAGKPVAEDTRPVVPEAAQGSGVPLLVGGHSERAFERAAEFGTGWTAGGLPPEAVGEMAEKVREAWSDRAREGKPKIVALAYYGLGDTEEESRANVLDYYEPGGMDAEMIADSVLRSPEAISGAIEGFAQAGVDELILDPTVPDPAQVDLLAEVVH